MSHVVLITISCELCLLVFNEHGVGFLEVIDFKVEAMNHGLELRDVILRCVNLRSSFFNLGCPNVKRIS